MRWALVGLLLVALGGRAAADPPPKLVGSTPDGRLVIFRADHPERVRVVTTSGLTGDLIGVDTRPADGRLYGVTTSNDVYRVDAATGACVLVSTLTVPFDGDLRSGIAFNPQADRLRLVSATGQNLRVNVLLGAAAVDGPLTYASGDAHAGKRPQIAGAGYTNAVRDAPTTKLFEIDAAADVLVVQDPPNDGVLATVGPLGLDVDPRSGFTIVTGTDGVDRAYAATGGTLYGVDLGSGRATAVGPIGDGRTVLVSLASLPDGAATDP